MVIMNSVMMEITSVEMDVQVLVRLNMVSGVKVLVQIPVSL